MRPHRRWFLAALLAASTTFACAEEARKYAVLSLIGDRFLVVSHVTETGTRVDRDRRDLIELPERSLDGVIAGDLRKSIQSLKPGAEVVMLGPTRGLYASQEPVTDDPDVMPVVTRVRPALEAAGVTHLVLVTKVRHEAMLRFENGWVGSGKLEGVGFYLDHDLLTQDREQKDIGRGFLAPFAYFRVTLVDVQRGSVLGKRDVFESNSINAGRSPSLMVWESLSSGQKVSAIRTLVAREGDKAIESLLQ